MLLDVCKSLKLRIVNGRLHSDAKMVNSHVKRSWEARRNWLHVDRGSRGIFSKRVGILCRQTYTISDHNQIISNIKAGYNVNHREEGKCESIEQWKWKESTRNEYIQNLRINIHRFENIVNNRNHTTQEAINDVISQFSDILLNIAGPFCLTVTVIRQGGSGFRCKRRNDAPWFDAECQTAKRTLTNAIYRYNK